MELADARVCAVGQGAIDCLYQSRRAGPAPSAGLDSPGCTAGANAAGKAAPARRQFGRGHRRGEGTQIAAGAPLAARFPGAVPRSTPPPGYQAGELPKDQSKQSGPLTITQHFQILKDGAVEATFRLDTGPGTSRPPRSMPSARRWPISAAGASPSGRFRSPSNIGPKSILPGPHQGRARRVPPAAVCRHQIIRRTTGIMPRRCW